MVRWCGDFGADALKPAVVLTPSRTLRAADAVTRRRAIHDRRCARRHWRRVGRDGGMVPIEQKDGTCGVIGVAARCGCHEGSSFAGLPATASGAL